MALPKPTQEEKDLLEKLRIKVGDILESDESNSDHFLVRWIRARDNDLDKAEFMLRSSLKWRKDNNVDKVLSISMDPWLFTNFPFRLSGQDKLGNPVLELPFGTWDMRTAINSGKTEELVAYITMCFESVTAQIKQRNDLKDDGEWKGAMLTVVADWDGYSYAQFLHLRALQSLLSIAATYESHYPEVLHKCFLINTPSIFPLLMGMFQSLLAPKTMAKISVFGSDRSEWEPEVLKVIDADQLGVEYGGIKSQEDYE